MTAFILQNQHGQFLSKENEWVGGSDANTLFRSPHYDVALNQLIEVNSKDYALRGAVVACELDSKGRPLVNSPDIDVPEPVAAEAEPEAGPEPERNAEVEIIAERTDTEPSDTLPTLDSDDPVEHEAAEESEIIAAHA